MEVLQGFDPELDKTKYKSLEENLDEHVKKLPTLEMVLNHKCNNNYLNPCINKLEKILKFHGGKSFRREENYTDDKIKTGLLLNFNPNTEDSYSFRLSEKIKNERIDENDLIRAITGFVFPEPKNVHLMKQKPDFVIYCKTNDHETEPICFESTDWRSGLNHIYKLK